ncbi:MAG: pyrroline-5-carboxylate reductase family protein [Dehalococcoidia bacterium]
MIQRVAILGAGAFGETMIKVIASADERKRGVEVIATHRRAERRAELEERYGVFVLADNREACEGADMIYPVVRPEQMADLMREIGPSIKDHQILAAGAASLRLPFYRRFLPSRCTLAWVFPTPFMTMCAGFLAIHPEPDTSPDKLSDLEEYWSRFCDEIVVIEEEAMDTFVILHASGQSYLWPIIKAYVDFGSQNGFSTEQAQAIVLSTLGCSARMLKEMDCSPLGLDLMMSKWSGPGTLTASGLEVLKRNYAESLYAQALEAARDQATRHRQG